VAVITTFAARVDELFMFDAHVLAHSVRQTHLALTPQ
jgi:hypothetical protein